MRNERGKETEITCRLVIQRVGPCANSLTVHHTRTDSCRLDLNHSDIEEPAIIALSQLDSYDEHIYGWREVS